MDDRRTPLHVWTISLHNLLADAHEALDAEGWRAFVWIAGEMIDAESRKLVVAEASEAAEES
jgi:hypothetical protein